VIVHTNIQLEAMRPEEADEGTRALIRQWGELHLVRAVLGGAATLAYLWAAL
jgi:hypothetical protein